jgi:hypothetical protein
MKRFWMGVVLALALAPAYAESTEAKADKPRVVCTKERTTGSNLRKRTCMTQAQSEERRKRDQEAMERMRSTPRPNDVSG